MGGASSYLAMLAICAFLSVAWFAGKVSRMAGISAIILEISTGIVLGPRVGRLISSEYAECEHRKHMSCKLPDNFESIIDQGMPIGKDVSRIIAMNVCDRAAYGLAPRSRGTSSSTTWPSTTSRPSATTYPAGQTALPGSTTYAPPGTTSWRPGTTPRSGDDGTSGGIVNPPTGGPPTFRTGNDDEAESGRPSPLYGQNDYDGSSRKGQSSGAASQLAIPGSQVYGKQPAAGYQASGGAKVGEEADNHTQATPNGSNQTGANHSVGDTDASVQAPPAAQGSPDSEATSSQALGSDDGTGGARRLQSSREPTYRSYQECLEQKCERDISDKCARTPDIFTIIGHAGVALAMFQAGLHFDYEKATTLVQQVGPVAFVGVVLPLFTGGLLTLAYGYPLVPYGISVGTALAPSSVAVGAKLLTEAGVLRNDFGEAIMTSASFQDILSLILFTVMLSFSEYYTPMGTVVNPIIGVAISGVAAISALRMWPRLLNEVIFPKLAGVRSKDSKVVQDDEILYFVMFGMLIGYAVIMHYLGCHLWGCFIAGMSFAACDPEPMKGHAYQVWMRQTKRLVQWMVRIFFACTIGFAIPVQEFFTFDAYWKGSIMAIGPCILAKVISAPHMGDAKWVIGWAMVARAEFAYFVAQVAYMHRMLDDKTFSITIWALLYATIVAPFVFRQVLQRYMQAAGIAQDTKGIAGEYSDPATNRPEPGVPAEPLTKSAACDPTGDSPPPPDTLIGKANGEPDLAKIQVVEDLLRAPSTEKMPDGTPVASGLRHAAQAIDPQSAAQPATRSNWPGASCKKRMWFGRRPTPGVKDANNGFLCCLFFKKIVLNQNHP